MSAIYHLVQVHTLVKHLYTVEFINSPITISNVVDYARGDVHLGVRFDFRVEGFIHGSGDVSSSGHIFNICQLTGKDIIYTQYYNNRHNHDTLLTLLHPIVEAKVRPELQKVLDGRL